MSQEFQHLLSPITLGPITIKNRIYSSPHHPTYINIQTGAPLDERVVHYWAAKAKGGVGMIGTCLIPIDARLEANSFAHPALREIFKRSSDAVHEHGAKIIAQLANSGGQGGGSGEIPWAPTSMLTRSSFAGAYISHEMTRDEISATIEAFADAARIAREVGMDGCSIHASHGYMVNEFMSPYYNRRTDEYGGSLENRMRFPLEMIDAVRDALGSDLTLGIRVNGNEFIDGGYTLDDFLEMAPILAGTGKLDFMSVSAGNYHSYPAVIDPMYFPLDSFVYCAAAVRDVVDIPVIARGRIVDPVQAEQILANGHGDMVSIVRGIIADPEFVNKTQRGQVDEIRKCLGCNEGCWGRTYTDMAGILLGMTCVMNPSVGREGLPGWGELIPAQTRKKVMVIGGGPAGLETARVAAERGHQVSLYERGTELGGQTLIAAKAPGRDGFEDLGRYFTYEMKRLGVDVHLETEATEESVIETNPDAVVIATGSNPFIPEIPGIDGDHIYEVRQVLCGEADLGESIIILAGELGMQALSTADFLAEQGKQVEVLYTYNQVIPMAVEPNTHQAVYQRLYENGVVVSVDTSVKKIDGSTVVAYNTLTGKERRIEGVDNVVVAYGGSPADALAYALQGRIKEIHKVGEARSIRKLHHITMDGATVGRQL